MNLVDRDIEPALLQISRSFSVVVITGPRQSGKTTLCKKIFNNKPYSNLEVPDVRDIAINDPRGYLQNFEDTGAIIDEIQHVPELLSYIQQIVDNNKIEIKSAQTFHPKFCKSLSYFEALFNNRVDKKIMVYTGDLETIYNGCVILNYKNLF